MLQLSKLTVCFFDLYRIVRPPTSRHSSAITTKFDPKFNEELGIVKPRPTTMNYLVPKAGQRALKRVRVTSRVKKAVPRGRWWENDTCVPMNLPKAIILQVLLLLVLWTPLAEANTP